MRYTQPFFATTSARSKPFVWNSTRRFFGKVVLKNITPRSGLPSATESLAPVAFSTYLASSDAANLTVSDAPAGYRILVRAYPSTRIPGLLSPVDALALLVRTIQQTIKATAF